MRSGLSLACRRDQATSLWPPWRRFVNASPTRCCRRTSTTNGRYSTFHSPRRISAGDEAGGCQLDDAVVAQTPAYFQPLPAGRGCNEGAAHLSQRRCCQGTSALERPRDRSSSEGCAAHAVDNPALAKLPRHVHFNSAAGVGDLASERISAHGAQDRI